MAEIKISLKAARINAEMEQTDVAAEMGVLRDTIGRWERGQTKPRTDQLAKLCELYRIPAENIRI